MTMIDLNFKKNGMHRVLVFITLSDKGIETIKSNPDLPKKEMEFINLWKEEGVLESFFISVSRKDAVLLFQNTEENTVRSLMEILPYFPHMAVIKYHLLNKKF
jgi:hypothetical protein